jgi:hypothetical protein
VSKVIDRLARTHAGAQMDALGAFAVLRELMADPGAQWSTGTFGAIAEFLRDPDEAASVDLADESLAAATSRGAVAVTTHPELRLVATESVSRNAGLWRHAIALCLPEASSAMSGRRAVTELGPDAGAVRGEDRDAILFDLGLGLPQTDACIRTSDPALLKALRASEAKALFEPGNGVLMDILHASPHRVFVSRVARVEVFQAIPPPNGKSPPGPHTHILPKLLRANRTHAATTPMPMGFVPCANVYPAHATFDTEGLPRAFDRARFEAFEELLATFGLPELVAAQCEVVRRVTAGEGPTGFSGADDKFVRGAVRVALRKLKASGMTSPALAAWTQLFDRSSDEDGDDEAQHAC